jgi:hypothetical protein
MLVYPPQQCAGKGEERQLCSCLWLPCAINHHINTDSNHPLPSNRGSKGWAHTSPTGTHPMVAVNTLCTHISTHTHVQLHTCCCTARLLCLWHP